MISPQCQLSIAYSGVRHSRRGGGMGWGGRDSKERQGGDEKIWQRDGWEESVPAKANQFGRDNKTRCLAETEDVIRANGPPNTPQVHGAAGSMIVGSVI